MKTVLEAPVTSAQTPSKPHVLRIVGDGRSGSTVIGTVLSQVPSSIFVGEVAQVWRAFTTPSWACSCGELVADCAFWRDVRSHSMVDTSFDVGQLRDTTERFLRIRPLKLANLMRRPLDHRLVEYSQALQDIYRAIAATAGADLVVDSTKSAPELLLAVRTFSIRLDVLHLVRDPRAVTHSQARPRPATMQSGFGWTAETAFTSSARWTIRNALIGLMLSRRTPVHRRMRYEDFVSHPALELRSLDQFVETTEIADQLERSGGQIAVGPRHALDGNGRVLEQRSKIQLRLDEEWKSAMPRSRRVAASIPALPLMLLYGYGVTVGS